MISGWRIAVCSFAALVVGAVLVSAALTIGPLIQPQDLFALPQRIAKSLGMQRVVEPTRKNIFVLNNPPKD
jgi:hypothetical protein